MSNSNTSASRRQFFKSLAAAPLIPATPSLALAGTSSDFDRVTPMAGLYAAEYRDFRSKAAGDDFRIFVAKPLVMEPGKKYPVIYALDGNFSFPLLMQTQRALALANEIPQAFVVGIGYPGEDFNVAVAKRIHNYTLSLGGEIEAAAIMAQPGQPSSQQPGGAPAFLQFLRNELKPAIEGAYPVDPANATLGGHSLGGLFPSWLLLTAPEVFQRYVILSPSMWWNNEQVWQWEKQYAAAHRDIAATVFVSAGGLETAAEMKKQTQQMVERSGGAAKQAIEKLSALFDKHGWLRCAEITPEFVDKLKARNYPSLKICVHNFADETHHSMSPGAWSRGLRYIFGQWNP